jgi:hypothetical protein
VPSIYPNASFTPNETRAAAIVAALKQAPEPAAILGISNEGNVLPLVAAAHPVRRLVYVNACIPQPGKAFIEVCLTEPVVVPGSLLDNLIKGARPVTDEFLKLRADPHATAAQWQTLRDQIQASPYASGMEGFYEVCPLATMPKVDNIVVSGSADDQIDPAWEQATARRVLMVEPVIVPGAGHASVVTDHAAQVADAAVRGLWIEAVEVRYAPGSKWPPSTSPLPGLANETPAQRQAAGGKGAPGQQHTARAKRY